ncbi:MAG TPA: transcription termination factor NusA [Dehalococcoidia bacterium]|nr:transcription termination factor NusA [Dehalococcoidia bacterium]
MKTEFMVAITQLSAEKNLSVDLVISAVESALVSAYRKNSFDPDQDIVVKMNPNTGGVKVFLRKTVVEKVASPGIEIKQSEARKIDKNASVGDIISIENTPPDAGRIAIQTARQVILQRLHEAEHHAIFEEFTVKEGEAITGMIQRVTPDNIYVDVGKAEALLPAPEQVHGERYRVGQRMKFYLLEVSKAVKGPQIIVSRSHKNLLKKLFELEVPEVHSGAVEIKSVAREAGHRSKVAVAARQEGIDPVGCCVGLRGIRIQNIVGELNDEKIDVVQWAEDTKAFIASALSPAQVNLVELQKDQMSATVIVPDKQLSLAIGKDGQNARLAAKLTGWRIDIKSLSAYEKEKAEKAATEEAAAPVAAAKRKTKAKAAAGKEAAPQPQAEPEVIPEPVLSELEPEEKAEEEPAEAVQTVDLKDFELVLTSAPAAGEGVSSQIRFAEDIMPSKAAAARKRKKEAEIKDKGDKAKKSKGKRVAYGDEEEF